MQSLVRGIRRLSTPAIMPEVAILPRLESHYFNVLYEDLMVMNYDHSSPALDHLEQDKIWNFKFNDKLYDSVYTLPLEKLPADRLSQLLTVVTDDFGLPPALPKLQKKLKNPIDYTPIRKEDFYRKPEPKGFEPYSPSPVRIPALKRIELEITAEDAVQNKQILLSAIMSLQSISGIRAKPVFATTGDASKKIRAGMPIGAKVVLKGQEMYMFLDKMVQCVLPRIREFKGLNPVNNQGAVQFTLPSSAVGTFPDIEPHFDMFPRLFDTKVTLQTSGQDDKEVFMLLSGFQVPFMDQVEEVKEVKKVDNDPWALIKNAKTREERKLLYAQITQSRKAKSSE